MTTSDFTNFFVAGTGAGAALIGLLFVAISIRPHLLAGRDAHPSVQLAVTMAFTALVNGFFISFASLLQGTAVGDIALVMGTLSLWSCVSGVIGVVRHPPADPTGRSWQMLARSLVLVAAGLTIYVWEIAAGWRAVQAPKDAGPVFTIAVLVLSSFGLGLVRAWELLGARSGAMLLRWISPLSELGEVPPPNAISETRTIPAADESGGGGKQTGDSNLGDAPHRLPPSH